MYSYDGSYFGSNGVLFHSNRPILCETYQYPFTAVAAAKGGTNTILGGVSGAGINIIDNAALFGVGSDAPGQFANFQSHGAIAPGSSGVPPQGSGDQGTGGWMLMSAFLPVGPFSGTSNTYGVIWDLTEVHDQPALAVPLSDIGCMQPGSTVHDNCGFAVDLIQRIPYVPNQFYAPGVFLLDPNGTNNNMVVNTASTCGETGRFSEIWMAVCNGNGGTVASIPSPITSIGTATTLTSATLNTSIGTVFTLLNNPPLLNVQVQSTGSIGANGVTAVPFTVTPLVDNFSGFNVGLAQYTVPLSGMYFCHANVIYATNWNVGQGVVGFTVNSTVYWGGSYNATPPAAQNTGISATKILDLHAGDVIEVVTKTSTNSQFGGTTSNVSHFIMSWLCPISTSTQSWTPPDTTGFLFAAGTPPGTAPTQLAGIMNTKIANDINFLLNRPYCSVHQTTAQTGLTVNSFKSITMQSTVGLVHGGIGDNYAGWSTANNCYVAPVPGWYLAVEEVNCATISTTNSYNMLIAGFSVPTSGGVVSPTSSHGQPDWYQHLLVGNAWTYPTGATGMNVYYLNAGETIAPSAEYQSGTATSFSTDVSHGFNSHFNVVWLSN
jgi:hypothetical protein